MVQRTDGTSLIVPRFLTAGVVTKRFQLKVKETGKQEVKSMPAADKPLPGLRDVASRLQTAKCQWHMSGKAIPTCHHDKSVCQRHVHEQCEGKGTWHQALGDVRGRAL